MVTGTCKAAKTMLKENNSQKHNSSKPWTSGEGQDLECYARLSSTDLYVLTCTNPEVDIHEVSLSFSFKIPDCSEYNICFSCLENVLLYINELKWKDGLTG